MDTTKRSIQNHLTVSEAISMDIGSVNGVLSMDSRMIPVRKRRELENSPV